MISIKTLKKNKVFEKEVRCHSLVKIISKEDEIIVISDSPLCAFSQVLKILEKNQEFLQLQEYFEEIHDSFFKDFEKRKESEEKEEIKNLKERINLEVENSFKLLEEIRRIKKENENFEREIKKKENEKEKLKSIIKLLYFGYLEENERKKLQREGLLKGKKIQISKIQKM
jgi:septal ring factor EnvC (AmiA/AmiB activator)